LTSTTPDLPPMPNTSRRLQVAIGVLAVLGGLAWTAAALLHASQPTGCVGDGCGVTRMREATTATSWSIGAAGALMVLSGAGLVLLVRRTGRLGRMGVAGAALCGLGVLTLAVAVVLQELVYGEDWDGMPYAVGPGVAALVVGAVLLGWTVLRSSLLPRWSGIALIVGALLLLGSNEQTSAVLLAVPLGLAWAATGLVLVLRAQALAGSRATASESRVSGVGGAP
jgi:hypothetical protein